jgi:ergothioneine biosynthesis protein EgtB
MTSPSLLQRYQQTREQSVLACEPLMIEDYGLQGADFASPPKWHLAHTSWFFETFLLSPFARHYETPNALYAVLFNSYYNGIGEQFSRSQRGLLSRPSVDEVMAYRRGIDEAMIALLNDDKHPDRLTILSRAGLGIEHEQQHQELFFTDLKYSLAVNPLYPAYSQSTSDTDSLNTMPLIWREFPGGLIDTGVDTADRESFSFDNEGPSHKVHLNRFALANRLVTNGEYQAFIDDGGYQRPDYWLADGWATVQQQGWKAPLYWKQDKGKPQHFTLHGLRERQPNLPACHLSGYEADAYASWAGARLPTECEWEYAAKQQPFKAPAFNANNLHPSECDDDQPLLQLYGDCWQWTGSAYRPYPGFTTSAGAIGEYNGKFMANQWVLRGGSCVSQSGHVRPSYRNFFYPQDRWQFSGLRLAKDL